MARIAMVNDLGQRASKYRQQQQRRWQRQRWWQWQ